MGIRRERKGVNVEKESGEEAVLEVLRERNLTSVAVEYDMIKQMTFMCMTCKPSSLSSTLEFTGIGFLLFGIS